MKYFVLLAAGLALCGCHHGSPKPTQYTGVVKDRFDYTTRSVTISDPDSYGHLVVEIKSPNGALFARGTDYNHDGKWEIVTSCSLGLCQTYQVSDLTLATETADVSNTFTELDDAFTEVRGLNNLH